MKGGKGSQPVDTVIVSDDEDETRGKGANGKGRPFPHGGGGSIFRGGSLFTGPNHNEYLSGKAKGVPFQPYNPGGGKGSKGKAKYDASWNSTQESGYPSSYGKGKGDTSGKSTYTSWY